VVIKLVPCNALQLQRQNRTRIASLVQQRHAARRGSQLPNIRGASRADEQICLGFFDLAAIGRRRQDSITHFRRLAQIKNCDSSVGGRLDSPYMRPVAGERRYCTVPSALDFLTNFLEQTAQREATSVGPGVRLPGLFLLNAERL